MYDTLLGSYVLGVPALTRRNRVRRNAYLGKSPNYGDAAFLEVQARLTDLVPMHPLALLIVFATGLGFIGGLELAYLWMLRAGPGMGRIAALDLTVRGSLGTWFASASFALASSRPKNIMCCQGKPSNCLTSLSVCFMGPPGPPGPPGGAPRRAGR